MHLRNLFELYYPTFSPRVLSPSEAAGRANCGFRTDLGPNASLGSRTLLQLVETLIKKFPEVFVG